MGCLFISSCGLKTEVNADKEKELTHITTKVELDKEYSNNKLVLIDFYADWCGPCVKLAPNLVKLDSTHGDKVKIIKVNVDKAAKLAEEYGISSIPAVYLVKDKKVIKKEIGYQSYEQLVKLIE
jgi:thioredoxin 1